MQQLILFAVAIAASLGAELPDLQFGANYNTIPERHNSDCGGALFGEGAFSTPQYPSPYPNLQSCTWTLTAPEGKVIRLVFTDFTVEYGVECSYDSVKIYNGPAVTKNPAKTLCGTKPLIEHVGGKVVTVVFTSNDETQETGFTAFFHSIADPSLPARHDQGGPSCGGDYQGAFGTIASPNFPNTYPSHANCSYTITVPIGSVHLEFLHLDIEYHHSCQRDYLEIREENSSGKLLRRLCGNSKSQKISSVTSSLHLRFISDYSLQGTGFYAFWKSPDIGTENKPNSNIQETPKGATQQATTTKRPIITIRQPSSTEPPTTTAGRSTTVRASAMTPEKLTAIAATTVAKPPLSEKSSTAAVTKPAVFPDKDNISQSKSDDSGKGSPGQGNHLGWNKNDTKGVGHGTGNSHDNGQSNGNGNVDGNGKGGNGNHLGWNKDSTNDSGKGTPGQGNHQGWNKDDTKGVGNGNSIGNGNGHSSGNGNVNGNGNGGNGNHLGWNKDNTNGVSNGNGNGHSIGNGKGNGNKNGDNGAHPAILTDQPKQTVTGTAPQVSTTRRPLFTLRFPSSTSRVITAVSSTIKPTAQTPGTTTFTPTTAKATVPPAEKTIPAVSTKPAIPTTTLKSTLADIKMTATTAAKTMATAESTSSTAASTSQKVTRDAITPEPSDEKSTKLSTAAVPSLPTISTGTTLQAATTRRPLFTLRLPTSTSRVITEVSSTMKPTAQTPETTTFTPTTAKATVPPAEKTIPAVSTKPAIPTTTLKSTLADIKMTATTAAKTMATAESTSSTAASTSQKVTRDAITLEPSDEKSTKLSTATVPGLRTVTTGPTPQVATTRRPLFTIILPTSTSRVITAVSSTMKPTAQTAGTTTSTPITAKETPSPAEKTSPVSSTKLAILTASPKSTLAEFKTTATAAVKTAVTTEAKLSTATSTFERDTEGSITPAAVDDKPTSPSTKTTPVLRTFSSGNAPTASPSICNIYPTSLTATPRPIPPNFDSDSCTSNGYLHRLVLNSCCSLYMHQATDGLMKLRECPTGTRFDVYSCACRFSEEVTCFDRLPSLPTTQAAPTDATSAEKTVPPVRIGDMCVSNSNVYRVVANSGCTKFTQQGEDSHVASHDCPMGTKFDLEVCTCRHAFEFQCSEKTLEIIMTTPASAPSWPAQSSHRPTDPPTRIGDVCVGHGKAFGVVPRTACTKFTQQTPDGRLFELQCPQGLKFDINVCVCRYDSDFTCPDKTQSQHVTGHAPQSRVTHLVKDRSCIVEGNVYAVLPGTGCTRFTQEVAGARPHLHSCPPGLGFDLEECVCRYFDEFSCSDKANGLFSPTTEPSPAVVRATPMTGRIGDACISHDNTYRLAPKVGCRWFTQTSSDGKIILHHCPDGLKFDLDVCVCRFSSEFVCLEEDHVPVSPVTVALKTTTIKATAAEARSDDSCFLNGATYRLLPYCGCSRYTQRRPTSGGDDLSLHECSAGNLFDLDKCACRPSGTFTCADPTQANILNKPVASPMRSTFVTTAEPTAAVSSRTCVAGGSVFRTIRNTSCRRFTQEAPGGRVFDNTCPGGLVFDMNLCVCRYASDVTCYEY